MTPTPPLKLVACWSPKRNGYVSVIVQERERETEVLEMALFRTRYGARQWLASVRAELEKIEAPCDVELP